MQINRRETSRRLYYARATIGSLLIVASARARARAVVTVKNRDVCQTSLISFRLAPRETAEKQGARARARTRKEYALTNRSIRQSVMPLRLLRGVARFSHTFTREIGSSTSTCRGKSRDGARRDPAFGRLRSPSVAAIRGCELFSIISNARGSIVPASLCRCSRRRRHPFSFLSAPSFSSLPLCLRFASHHARRERDSGEFFSSARDSLAAI